MGSGYDLSSRHPFRLMQGRLGTYEKRPFDSYNVDPEMDNIKHQATLLKYNGGNKQQERMIKDKRRSLDRAVWFSYQAAEVRKINSERNVNIRALINPNKLKQDYDDKIISIGYEYDFKCGDVFEWIGTNTHWLIYLQDMTELAYFRGDIRKCSYEISWTDEAGMHTTYAAVRGPVETQINYIQKHGISIDNPNYSLNMLLPLNEETLSYFQRYQKFYLQNEMSNSPKICWRVQSIDWISTPGILEVNAIEYYANETEDDVENGIVGGLIVKPESPNNEIVEETIIGDTFIKPKKAYEFYYSGNAYLDWEVDKKYPLKIQVDEEDSRKITLTWTSTYSGQFELTYGDCTKIIVVESLF